MAKPKRPSTPQTPASSAEETSPPAEAPDVELASTTGLGADPASDAAVPIALAPDPASDPGVPDSSGDVAAPSASPDEREAEALAALGPDEARLRAPDGIAAASVAGVEYPVREGHLVVPLAHVPALLEHGFARVA